MLKKKSLAFINDSINKALALDDQHQTYLKPLADKILAIHIDGLDKTIYCCFSKTSVQLDTNAKQEANTTISGGPFSLLNIVMTKNLNIPGVKIEGEIATAQQAKTLAEHLDIDWEELLASKIGDTPAYHISKIGQKLKRYFTKQGSDFKENVSDYLKDEKEWLIAPEQADAFFHEVDQCRLHVDRLQARIQQLINEINT